MRAPSASSALTLRRAFPDDREALERLAALDSARPLDGAVLVAEVEGESRAAMSLADGSVIADPFYPCTALVVLLRTRAGQLVEGRRRRLGTRRLGAGPRPRSVRI
jgi:hypothetical protein